MGKYTIDPLAQEKLLGAIKEHLQAIRQELELLRDLSNEMIDLHTLKEDENTPVKPGRERKSR